MSNSPTIKLYTEQQVTELTTAAFLAGQNHNPVIFGVAFEKITPIELPTDEEIYIEAQNKKDNIKKLPFDSVSFQFGAMWLRDKIQGGNK